MVRAQRRRYLPADTSQHEVRWEMGSLEAHGHESSPSLGTLDHRGRSYLKWPQMNFATYMDPPTMSSGRRTDTRKRTDAVIYPACA